MGKVYIAGSISKCPNYVEIFDEAQRILEEQDFIVLNPATLPSGFSQGNYMDICFAMIRSCEYLYLLNNWEESEGAKLEKHYAEFLRKNIIYPLREGI